MNVQSINNYTNQSFRGDFRKTDKGNQYYAVNTVRNINLAFVGLDAVGATILNPKSLIFIFPTGAFYGWIGSHVDNKRNKKAAEAADLIQEKGLQKALELNDRIDTNKGKPYYKSNEGVKFYTKWGAISGAVAGGLVALLSVCGAKGFNKRLEEKLGKNAKPIIMLLPVTAAISGAFSGWINGLISDYITNIKAKRHA